MLSLYFENVSSINRKVPIFLETKNQSYINPPDIQYIAGYALSFTDDEMVVFIKEGILKNFKNPKINIATLIDNDSQEDAIYIHKILGIYLVDDKWLDDNR